MIKIDAIPGLAAVNSIGEDGGAGGNGGENVRRPRSLGLIVYTIDVSAGVGIREVYKSKE